MDDFWTFRDAVNLWHNGLPPPRRMPAADEFAQGAPVARPPRSAPRLRAMARMLVVRAVRAAADG